MKTGIGAVQAAVMVLAGIFTGLQFHPSLWFCAVLAAAGLAGGIVFNLRGKNFELDQLPKRIARVFFSLALFAAGMGRTAFLNNARPIGAIENFAGQKLSGLSGYIVSPPIISNSRTTLRVQIDKKQPTDNLPNEGKVLLVFYRDPGIVFHYGDRLSVNGTVTLPPDNGGRFSYRTYLERNGITAIFNNPYVELQSGSSGNPFWAKIYTLREILIRQVFQLFPKPENALMAGILLGDESKITSDVERDFEVTGTAHIIAISGANFTLLTWLLLGIIRRIVPDYRAPLLMLPFIWFYTILVGANSAVIRAAIMCSLSIIGSVLGRRGNGINNLALTSALMCLWKPVMLYDLGFQLSVTATLGILLFTEPLQNLTRSVLSKAFPKMSEEALTSTVRILSDLCLMSISAQILTTWVIAQASGQISLISIPANLLVAPFQSLIVLGGFAALLLSFLFYPLGAAAAWLIWAAPALTIRIVHYCAEVKWGSVYFNLGPFQAWVIIGLILALWSGRRLLVNSIRRRNFRPYAALLLLFFAVMIWVNALSRLSRRIEIDIHQTASSSSYKICTWQNRCYVIGDQMTNYGAQDLLTKQILPIEKEIEAAWFDIPERWMQRDFLSSDSAGELSVLYVNGESKRQAAEIPDVLNDGFVFIADDIQIHYITSFLGKRCWILEKDGLSLLFPNGVPPERIFTRTGPVPQEISLVLLGKKDDLSLWNNFHSAHQNQPQLQDFSAKTDLTLILRNDGIYYR
ncbi:MAG: ComEC/Rec2 family competence protein [Anaerolineaceae bacterium]|nr:ComEC/Rec2 family competence protein [Anaerolineaceae bacterium]